jgi:hypothetical protein
MNFKFASLALTTVSVLAFHGVASAQETPICTDRPTKSNAVCTVPKGAWQVEADGVNWTRSKVAGVKADTTAVAATTLKVGLTDASDLQLTWTPYVEARTRGPGVDDKLDGVGDVWVRYKVQAYAQGKATVAVIPYVKVPTASRGLGNDKVEGGAAAPVSFALDSATLTFNPQVDLLLDSAGSGRHAGVTNTINLARPVTSKLTLVGELWTFINFDPADTVTQFSADVAATYLVTPTLQLDGGANFGLNRNTPDVQLYVGVSKRF